MTTPTALNQKKEMPSPAINALRWIAVLPCALLAGTIASIVIKAGNNLTFSMQGMNPDSFLSRVFIEGVSNAVFGAAGVYAGARMAPNSKAPTVFALAVVFVLLAGLLMFPALAQENWWSVFGAGMMVIGAAGVAWTVYSGEQVIE